MNPTAVWLAALLGLPLLGAPLLLHSAYRAFSGPARLVLSGGVGAVVLSFSMTAAALASWPWRIPLLVLFSLALSAGLRAFCGRPAPADRAARFPRSELFATVLSGAAVAIALVATLGGGAGSPDLLLFWGPKAQAFAAARSIDAGFLASPAAAGMHPYYPPLLTNLYAFATLAAGAFPWKAAVLTFPIALAALSAALPSLLRRSARPWAPAAASALAVSALALIGTETDAAGNAEAWLWLFEILGLALLLSERPVSGPSLLLSGLLFAGAATTKVEALPFVLAAALGFAAFDRRRSGPAARAGALLLGPTVAGLGLWFAFGLPRRAFAGYGEYGSLLDLRWDRAGLVLRQLGAALAACAGALPFLVPVAVALLCLRGLRGLPLGIAAVLSLFLWTAYLLPVGDTSLWIEWSSARTLSPIAALFALSLGAPPDRRRPKIASAARSESPDTQSPAENERGR